jgi:hypothetical protein
MRAATARPTPIHIGVAGSRSVSAARIRDPRVRKPSGLRILIASPAVAPAEAI